MEKFPLAPFTDPRRHQLISEIIQRHSTNATDIRGVALDRLELSGAKNVLELGCGFGFMSQAVAARISAHGRIVGVDACPENGPAFLAAVRSEGREAEFQNQMIDRELPWPDECFDLVLASYSLYFFPNILPEIARVLRSCGTFVVITHSERSFARLCDAAGLALHDAPVFRLIRQFSAENGEERLAGYFAGVERIEYPNQLRFERGQLEDLLNYARFKLPLFAREHATAPFPDAVMQTNLKRLLERGGSFFIEKDDTVFHARSPRCP